MFLSGGSGTPAWEASGIEGGSIVEGDLTQDEEVIDVADTAPVIVSDGSLGDGTVRVWRRMVTGYSRAGDIDRRRPGYRLGVRTADQHARIPEEARWPLRRPGSAACLAVASWILADAGVSAETFGKCLTQLHWTSPRERLASDVPFLCPFPNGKFKGVIRPNGPWCVPHPRPRRLAPRPGGAWHHG